MRIITWKWLKYIIILLDQFSRNIYRTNNEINICDYTNKACLLSNIWINNKYYLTEAIEHTVFALLPIRHTRNILEIQKLLPILDEIKEYKNYINNENVIFNKFYIHTCKSLSKI